MLKFSCLVLFFFNFTIPLYSIGKIDSIELELNKVSNDKYNSIFISYLKELNNSNIDRAYSLISTADSLAKKATKSEQVELLNTIGTTYNFKGETLYALKYFDRALAIGEDEKLHKESGEVLMCLGMVYRNLGSYNRSISAFQRMLEHYQAIDNKEGIGSAKNALGAIYKRIGNDSLALEYYNSALEIYKENNFRNKMPIELLNICEILLKRKDYKKVKNYIDIAYSIQNTLDIKREKNNTYGIMAEYFRGISQKDSADYYYKKTINGYLENGDQNGVNKSKISYADFLINDKRSQEAYILLVSALDYFQKANNLHFIIDAYEKLIQLYSATGDYKNAFYSQVRLKEISDSAFSNAFNIELAELANKNEFDKKETELKLMYLDKKRYLNGLELILALAVMLVITSVILFQKFKQNRSLSALLKEQNTALQTALQERNIQHKTISEKNIELSSLFKRLEKSEEQLHGIIENSTIGIYRTTPDGKILFVNKTLRSILKIPEDYDISEMNLESDNLYTNYKRKDFTDGMAKNSSVIGLESEWSTFTGDLIFIRESATIVRDENGAPLYYDGVIEDVSDKKIIEFALIESEKQLRESNKTKDKFFSIIAHDLKNPMQALILITELLSASFDKLSKSEVANSINTLNRSTHNLNTLLDNLLNWSRLQTGKIEFSPAPISISHIVADNINLFKLSANNKNIEIRNEMKENIIIQADKSIVSTILRNLISNAIKFSPENSNIIIDSKFIEENKKQYIAISVRDFGEGISKAKANELLEAEDIESSLGTKGEAGTGLGLLLCKEFVEIHHGKLWVESETHKGTTFYFSLPYKDENIFNFA